MLWWTTHLVLLFTLKTNASLNFTMYLRNSKFWEYHDQTLVNLWLKRKAKGRPLIIKLLLSLWLLLRIIYNHHHHHHHHHQHHHQ